jgi:hypothetical protein
MVCGILAYKEKRRAAQTEPPFFYSMLGRRPEWVERPYSTFRAAFLLAPQLAASFIFHDSLQPGHAAHGLRRPSDDVRC